MALFELSSKKYSNGRRPFTAALYELQPPECVVDDIGTKYNKNGITFLEEYAKDALDSIQDMSVRVAFIDDERTLISDHGDTGVEDGLPLFNNATNIGHFTHGYIDDVEINGETKRCVCGKGFLDEMAYHPFIQTIEEDLNNGYSVDGSIEIYRTENNDAIVYKNGWREKGRIPTEYIHSGWDMVLSPADSSSMLLELNNSKQNKEEKEVMEFTLDDIKNVVQSTVSELNDKTEELNSKIAELNSVIEQKDSVVAEKDAQIVECNATIEQVRKALQDLEADRDAWWAERDALQKQLGELKAKERLGELNSAIEGFSEDEQKFAEVEINSFKEDPMKGDIDAIVGKIYAEIGKASKAAEAARVSEINSKKEEVVVEDIFSEICTEIQEVEPEEIDIFG